MTSTARDTQKKTRPSEAEAGRSSNAAFLGRIGKPIAIATMLVAAFFALQSRLPLRTAVQIGADEGFELAKATRVIHWGKPLESTILSCRTYGQ